MLAQPLQRIAAGAVKKGENTHGGPYQYTISDHGYGKDAVKVLHVERNGPVHTIKEFEVGTHLKLYSTKDYLQGKAKYLRFTYIYIYHFCLW